MSQSRPSETALDGLADQARTVSDAVLLRLLTAVPQQASLAKVRAVFTREQAERVARASLFSPLRPFVAPGVAPVQARLPQTAFSALWSLARAERPADCDALVSGKAATEPVATRQDELCRVLARLIAERVTPASVRAAQALAASPGGAAAAATLLELAPMLRAAIPQLTVWIYHLTRQSAAELRAAFSEAARLGEDAGPLFIEGLATHLAEPGQALRLIALILDRPTDAFLASSPLASIAEQLISGVEAAIDGVRRLSLDDGLEAASEAGAGARRAALTLLEFEQWVELSRSGPWSGRLTACRRGLALAVEAQLKLTPRLLAEALPTRAAGWTARATRRTPVLDGGPDPTACLRAESQAAFIGELRATPAGSGFSAMRTKATDALEQQLDVYVEDLLDRLHRAEPDERSGLEAYLTAAARITTAVGGEAAGAIVRRRAAAA